MNVTVLYGRLFEALRMEVCKRIQGSASEWPAPSRLFLKESCVGPKICSGTKTLLQIVEGNNTYVRLYKSLTEIQIASLDDLIWLGSLIEFLPKEYIENCTDNKTE